MADNLVHELSEVKHFMHRCLKFKTDEGCHSTIQGGVYKEMQKKAKQMKVTSYFTTSFDCPSVKHAISCNHHDIFHPGTQMSFQ